jgi:hypothetical protein
MARDGAPNLRGRPRRGDGIAERIGNGQDFYALFTSDGYFQHKN